MNPAPSDAARLLLKEHAVMLSLPAICVQLRRVLDDPQHSRQDVAQVLRCDPALTARVLRVVNSACYGLPRQVSSVSQALGILGEQELQNLVLVTSLIRLSREIDVRFDPTRFWQCSIHTAVLTRHFCPPSLKIQRDDCFIAGLLLNIGKLPLYCKEPLLLAAVDEALTLPGSDELAIERSLTGTDHAQLGALLAESWNFPPRLVDLIASHHETVDASTDAAHCVLRLARRFGDWLERQTLEQSASACPALYDCRDALALLGLTPARLEELLQRAQAEYLEVHELFCGELH